MPPREEAPAVSVLLPTFERPDLLRVALESALAQELGSIEILIGDNSDSDSSASLVAEYEDPRIIYHRNEEQLGPQANWLHLADQARSPLVASLHDDDFWDPAFLSTVVPPMLEDESIAMTFTDFWIVDESG
ncbi:MAG: glycosyltransferase family 2 protein, partial [Acidimicrobiales bacterium]